MPRCRQQAMPVFLFASIKQFGLFQTANHSLPASVQQHTDCSAGLYIHLGSAHVSGPRAAAPRDAVAKPCG